MRKIFWSTLAAATMLWIVWELLFGKKELLPYLILCAALFAGFASFKRPQSDDDLAFFLSPFAWTDKLPDFWKEIQAAAGAVAIVLMIYWSSFIDWNKWGSVVAQVAIVGIVASSLVWVGFSNRLETYKHKRVLFWGAWVIASLVLSLLINRWLILILSIPFFFGNWAEENEKLNSSYRTPSH